MSTTPVTTKKWQSVTKPNVTKLFQPKPSSFGTTVHFVNRKDVLPHGGAQRVLHPLVTRPDWSDREYREAYMEASIEQGVAWQIRINRKLRNMTQKQLAEAIGTQQSAVSRMEDPTYGAHNLETLVNVAKVFDCALTVKFSSYGDLATASERLSETDQYAAPYELEVEQCNDQD